MDESASCGFAEALLVGVFLGAAFDAPWMIGVVLIGVAIGMLLHHTENE